MSFTKKSKSSKGGGIIAILFGIVLLIVLTIVLFINEGNSVNRAKALKNIADAVEISNTDMNSVNESLLVLFSGTPATNTVLTDGLFGVTAPSNSIKLERSVEMYQWHERSETDDDDDTTYEYYQDWSSTQIDSTDFEFKIGHQNPIVIAYDNMDYVADDVKVGSYDLDYVFVKKLNHFKPYVGFEVSKTDMFITSIQDNSIFFSAEGYSSIEYPDVGDLLVSFAYVPAEMITVVGMKSGSSLKAYETKTGDLAEVSYGVKDKETVMEEKLTENTIKTWAIRVGSIIGLMVAVALIFSPITNLLVNIPLIGNMINRGIGLVGAVLGAGWGLLVIAFGWLFYKPFLSIGLILIVVGMIVFFSMKSKNKTTEEAPAV